MSSVLVTGPAVTGNGTAAIGQLPATTTNDNAAAGKVGELISSTVVSASAVTLTTGVSANVTSISLTAGDWDVSGITLFQIGSTATIVQAGGSTTTAALPGVDSMQQATLNLGGVAVIGDQSVTSPTYRLSLASTTTVFLVAFAAFASTGKAYGTIRARRIR